MISRTHSHRDCVSEAIYSDCEAYRYLLTRTWQENGERVLFIMLNPSTATEVENDPTVERCERRARAMGFGAFRVANIFAFRATDPREMRAHVDPIGPDNDGYIRDSIPWAHQTICAWGSHGAHLERGARVSAMLRSLGGPLFHLGLTKHGEPRHPLYIAYSVKPEQWRD